LNEDGLLSGTISKTYTGYSAIEQRQKIKGFSSETEYFKDFDNNWAIGTIKNFSIDNLDDISKSISEKMEVEIEAFDDMKAPTLYFNPFIFNRMKRNPFKSKERLYPVIMVTHMMR
jgi:hypothetical protein